MDEQDKITLYQALSDKRMVLYSILQLSLTDENADTFGPAIQIANLEFQLCNAAISELLNDAPMAYPSPEQVQELIDWTAATERALQNSHDVEALLLALDNLIKTWPN